MTDDIDAPTFEREPRWFSVAVYLTDLAYGGPEEGGWYYEYGERSDSFPPMIAATHAEAWELCRTVNSFLNAYTNAGRRDISSVLSEGRYTAQVYPEYPPSHYPEQRPHYE